ESAYCASKAAVNTYLEGLRIAVRKSGLVVTTVCPGFVRTAMAPMESPAPFAISAQVAATRIARLIAKQKGGVVCFPWATYLLVALLARLPDALVASVTAGKPRTKQRARSLTATEQPAR